MGIVVCLSMLCGLVILQPFRCSKNVPIDRALNSLIRIAFAFVLGLLGTWNALYGVLNIDGFWRWASLITGIVMIMSALIVVLERKIGARVLYPRRVAIVLLASSFVLYAVTIVQLNLGYPILR